MTYETTRSVCAFGSSLAITIPREWARCLGIKRGDKLRVLYDTILIALPLGAEEMAKEERKLIRRVLE